jgi:uncharacterized protein (TIGR02597 family)
MNCINPQPCINMSFRLRRVTKLLAVLVALPLVALAEAVNTDPVGFVNLTTLSNSDTIFSTPLARPEVFRGLVGAVSSSTITASGTPGWTAGAFAYAAGTQSNTYYLRFRTGAKAGSFFTVTANTTTALTLDLAGDLLTGVAAGDEFAVIPYWTLGTVFPPSAAGTAFEASINAAIRKTEIYFPNQTATGVNLPIAGTYYFSGGAWRKFVTGGGTENHNDTVLPPDSYVTIRNKAFTGTVTVMGGVVTGPQATPVSSYATAKQDNYVAFSYPVAVSLRNSGLVNTTSPSTGVVRSSINAAVRTDEIYVYDNTVPGINKTPVTYYYANGAWRKFVTGGSTVDAGDDIVFQPGTGVVIRRGLDSSGPRSVYWSFVP